MKHFFFKILFISLLACSCQDGLQDNTFVIEAIVPCMSEMKDNTIALDNVTDQFKVTSIFPLRTADRYHMSISISGLLLFRIVINQSLPQDGAIFDLDYYSQAETGKAGIMMIAGSHTYESESGQVYFYFKEGKPVVVFCNVGLVRTDGGYGTYSVWGKILGE
jgi:hypothetical protein